jgi:hypothetical protein
MLNMELDLPSLFGLHVHSCILIAETPQPPPTAFGLIYEGAIGQTRLTTSLCDPLVGKKGVEFLEALRLIFCRLCLPMENRGAGCL